MQSAISRWRRHSLSCAWDTWVAQTKQNFTILNLNFDLMSQKVQSSRLSITWLAWRSRLKYKKALHSTFLTATDSLHDIKLKAYFKAWKQRSFENANLKDIMHQAVHALVVTKLWFAFWAWTSKVRHNLFLREHLKKMLYRLLEARLAMAFTKWREAATTLRQRRDLVFRAMAWLKYQVRPTSNNIFHNVV